MEKSATSRPARSRKQLKLDTVLAAETLGESCRDWTSSSVGPVLYITYYCITWHPLSIISLISGISGDTVNFDEIAERFYYLSPKVCFLWEQLQ